MKLLCLLGAANAAVTWDSEWLKFKSDFDRFYSTHEEELHRYNIFADHLKFIREHNARHEQGLETFTVGVNRFADMTNQEFRAAFNGLLAADQVNEVGISKARCTESVEEVASPSSYDARDHGLVTAMKDQGQCGSCWAFGTVATYEGQVCKLGKKNCNTWSGASEQAVVSCSKSGNICMGSHYDNGCNGGWVENGLKYLQCEGGVEETSYPYVSGVTKKTGTCREGHGTPIDAKVTGCAKISSTESAVKSAVSSRGPLGVSMDASHQSFQLYRSGTYSESKCSSTRLDHAVTIVGYKKGSGIFGGDNWIVKNSWGTSWGMEGYFEVGIAGNECGLMTEPILAIVE